MKDSSLRRLTRLKRSRHQITPLQKCLYNDMSMYEIMRSHTTVHTIRSARGTEQQQVAASGAWTHERVETTFRHPLNTRTSLSHRPVSLARFTFS